MCTNKANTHMLPGILRDKTMHDKYIFNLEDDKQKYPFCRSKLMVEKLEHYFKDQNAKQST